MSQHNYQQLNTSSCENPVPPPQQPQDNMEDTEKDETELLHPRMEVKAVLLILQNHHLNLQEPTKNSELRRIMPENIQLEYQEEYNNYKNPTNSSTDSQSIRLMSKQYLLKLQQKLNKNI